MSYTPGDIIELIYSNYNSPLGIYGDIHRSNSRKHGFKTFCNGDIAIFIGWHQPVDTRNHDWAICLIEEKLWIFNVHWTRLYQHVEGENIIR